VHKVSIVVTRPGFAEAAVAELAARWKISARALGDRVVETSAEAKLPAVRETVFVRQTLSRATNVASPGANTKPEEIARKIATMIAAAAERANRSGRPWTLHAFAVDHDAALAASARIAKDVIRALEKTAAGLAKRRVTPDVFAGGDQAGFVVQILAADVDDIWVAINAPSSGMELAVGGVTRMRRVSGTPSRSGSKLEEALAFANLEPKKDETAVDLGAAPGGWSIVLARRGVSVIAVDKASLEIPTALKARVTHETANGLKYRPLAPVDWLCCDMVIDARKSLDVLQAWCREDLMRGFVFNLKFSPAKAWSIAEEALRVREELLGASGGGWRQIEVRQLFHDRNEITMIGRR